LELAVRDICECLYATYSDMMMMYVCGFYVFTHTHTNTQAQAHTYTHINVYTNTYKTARSISFNYDI